MRRTKIVTIEDRQIPNPDDPNAPAIQKNAGRDLGKTFVIKEMPSTVGHEWKTQLGYLIARAMQEFPSIMSGSNADQFIKNRILNDPSLLGWHDCVKYRHDPRQPDQAIHWGSEACQIDETDTINFLLNEVYELHTGFFPPESPSTTDSPSSTTGSSGSLSTQTSRRPLGPLSPQGKPR